MTIFNRAHFTAFVEGLSGTTLVDQWEACVAKVGGKVFSLLSDDGQRIVFKVTEESFEILTALAGISQAPYFAKRKWVSVQRDSALDLSDIEAYLKRSHGHVAAGLTRKLRAELGIV